ncbi:hypothetical protein GCM10010347_02140 [Streptomyces cirratus]|uniref:DUF1795 domain-containing protein n=1 Tax=Streptomyces cirratus TaxID=68187 RepID=A0ABQ3EGW1_9ACTN|nr:hypothetical protein [Streptomyces cirratus]GHB36457.1 hypothetical protein GCM10010347_02140 [Streptomyces cirratus]
MPTTLPVPIEFSLPEGWRAAPPDEVGAPEVAFIALYPQPDDGFTSNITLDGGFLRDETTMEELADASVQQLLGAAESVTVATRHEIGSAQSPGLTQRLTLTAVVAGVRRDLVQSQVYMALTDVTDPHRRALVRSILTATAAQHDDVLPDFQEFLRTVRPDTGTGA